MIKIEETKTKYKALDIAKYIAYKCTNDLKAVSNLHLNRLLFFIQGEYFIKTGDFLFQDDFKAYLYGVIIDEVYHKYRYYGGSNIYESEQGIPLDIRTEIIIDRILEKFYNISYYKIVNMTQWEGGAWDATYENGLGKRGIILKKLIVKDCLHYINKEIDTSIKSKGKQEIVCVEDDNMKNIIGYKGYQAKIEFSAEDSTLFGTVINTNDKIIFEVDNPEKAMSIFKEVIDDYLELTV